MSSQPTVITRSRGVAQGLSGERFGIDLNQAQAPAQATIQAQQPSAQGNLAQGQEAAADGNPSQGTSLDHQTSPTGTRVIPTIVTGSGGHVEMDIAQARPHHHVGPEGGSLPALTTGETGMGGNPLAANQIGNERDRGDPTHTLENNPDFRHLSGHHRSNTSDVMRADLLQHPHPQQQQQHYQQPQTGILPTQFPSSSLSTMPASSASYGWNAPTHGTPIGPLGDFSPTSLHRMPGQNPEWTYRPLSSNNLPHPTSHPSGPALSTLAAMPMDADRSTSMMTSTTSSTASTPLLHPTGVTVPPGLNNSMTWLPQDTTRALGGQIVLSSNSPPLITELSPKKVTEHRNTYEVFFVQSQGKCVHAGGYLTSDARRFLAILCKAHGVPDYSDFNVIQSLGLSSADWYKRVLSILHAQFPSEREERNLKLRSVAGFMQWVAGVTKYYEETNPSYEQALRIVLDGLSNFEQEQGLLRNAMVQRAKNHRSCTREDIIFEATSILHFSNLFDKKRPHDESKSSSSHKRAAISSTAATAPSNQHSSSNFRRSQQNYRSNSGGGNSFRRQDNRNDGPYQRGHGHFSNRSGQGIPNTNHSTHSSAANSNSANTSISSSSSAGSNNQQNYQRRFNPGYQGKPPTNNQGGNTGGAAGNGQGSSGK